jgi:predicted DNA-binding transcriptional regulator AlpA
MNAASGATLTAANAVVLSVLLDFDAVAAMLGRRADGSTRQFVTRLVKRGHWPAPIQLQPNGRIFWRRAEVDHFLATRPRVKYAKDQTSQGDAS